MQFWAHVQSLLLRKFSRIRHTTLLFSSLNEKALIARQEMYVLENILFRQLEGSFPEEMLRRSLPWIKFKSLRSSFLFSLFEQNFTEKVDYLLLFSSNYIRKDIHAAGVKHDLSHF